MSSCEKTAISVAQEDRTHHRQEVFIAGVVGISPQRVSRGPETPFDGFDMFELGHGSSCSVG